MTLYDFSFRPEGSATWYDASSYGVWVSEYPSITRAEERVEFVEIPGRDGSLTLRGGVDNEPVYDAYEATLKLYMRQTGTEAQRQQRLHEFFRVFVGSGQLIYANAAQWSYRVHIHAQVDLVRAVAHRSYRGDEFLAGEIDIKVQPYKELANSPITIVNKTATGTATKTITPAVVPAAKMEPLIELTGSSSSAGGNLILGSSSANNRVLSFASFPGGTLTLDARNKLLYKRTGNDYRLYSHLLTGDWPVIVSGAKELYVVCNVAGVTQLKVDPRAMYL